MDASTLTGLGYNPLNPLNPMDIYGPGPHQQRADCYGWGQTGSSAGYVQGIKGMEGKGAVTLHLPLQKNSVRPLKSGRRVSCSIGVFGT